MGVAELMVDGGVVAGSGTAGAGGVAALAA
jgi:hypothetical protein